MNRIDPDFVARAFEKYNIQPIQGMFGDNQRRACGLGVCMYERGYTLDFLDTADHDDIFKTLSLDPDYALGFVNGFDNEQSQPDRDPEAFRLGYEDGRKAWLLSTGSKDALAVTSSLSASAQL